MFFCFFVFLEYQTLSVMMVVSLSHAFTSNILQCNGFSQKDFSWVCWLCWRWVRFYLFSIPLFLFILESGFVCSHVYLYMTFILHISNCICCRTAIRFDMLNKTWRLKTKSLIIMLCYLKKEYKLSKNENKMKKIWKYGTFIT